MKTIKETLELALEALEETRNALAWFYDSYPQDVTKKGNELLPHVETVLTALREALAEQPAQQEPVGCEGAIVNGRVYADRLEHDYKFECEAGPLHLCADWVELRRCFEWMAQHTSPPAQRTWVGLTEEEIEKLKHLVDWTASWSHGRFAYELEAKLKEKNA